MADYNLLIQRSLAPDRVRTAFNKLLATGDPIAAVDELSVRRLVRVAECSHFAIDILRSYEEAWDILRTGDYSPLPRTDLPSLRKDLALSLFQVAVIDLLGLRPFPDTLTLLSEAADRSISAAHDLAAADLERSYGRPTPSASYGLAIMGLGKLGGRELNFSSDIDLIFVYRENSDRDETTGGTRGKLSHVEWHTRLCEKIVDHLSSRLVSQVAWRVDLRLRPEGHTGPLVRSLESTLRYYEREGLAWERQMLIKMRCVGGDAILGATLIAKIEPFVYRRYLDRESAYQIEAIKARIEAQSSQHAQRHVKLSIGGIREIEFIVQILQLANGGRCPEIRLASTLKALNALSDHSYIFEEDRAILSDAYLFLRQLEHRLQMLEARQTHLLPENADEMTDLALRMGLCDGDVLWNKYLAVTESVRRIYTKRFERSKEISVTPIEEKIIRILNEAETEETREKAVMDLGLDPGSISELNAMSRSSMADPKTSSVRRIFISSTPTWMPILLDLPAPQDTLKRISRIMAAYGAKAALYEILKTHPPVANLLVHIAALSSPLSDLICRDPSTLETLLSPGGLTQASDRNILIEKIRTFGRKAKVIIQAEERLRIGVRFLMGIADARETGKDLASLAELLLGETDFVIVALGRFGGGDLGMASDLDLVFVAPEGVDLSKTVQARLDEWQKLNLRIDLRLRPMGRTSATISSIEFLRSYFERTAETWERLVWTRARVISGPPELRENVDTAIRNFIFAKPFGDKEFEEMRAMRKRLRNEASRPDDLKRGAGGMIDVEFLAAARCINQKTRETNPASVLKNHPDLIEAYTTLKTVEATTQVVTGRAYRGDEPADDRKRIDFLLGKRDLSLHQLGEYRAVLADALKFLS